MTADEADPFASTDTTELLRITLEAAKEDPSRGSDERWERIWALHGRGGDDVFAAAAKWCASADPLERSLGADVLSQLGVPPDSDMESPYAARSEELLNRLLDDPEWIVVDSAVVALGHLQPAGDVTRLVELARHDVEELRVSVAFALSGRAEPEALAALLKLTGDPDDDVRSRATVGLASLCELDTPEIRASLELRMSDEDPEIRGEAMVGLARRGDPAVIPYILEELEEDEVLSIVIEAAACVASPELVPPLEMMHEAWPDDEFIADALERCRAGKSPSEGAVDA